MFCWLHKVAHFCLFSEYLPINLCFSSFTLLTNPKIILASTFASPMWLLVHCELAQDSHPSAHMLMHHWTLPLLPKYALAECQRGISFIPIQSSFAYIHVTQSRTMKTYAVICILLSSAPRTDQLTGTWPDWVLFSSSFLDNWGNSCTVLSQRAFKQIVLLYAKI